MNKKVFLKDAEHLLEDLENKLKRFEYNPILTGGLKQRGYTSHDVDLEIKMPFPKPPHEEIFVIINDFGNKLWKQYGLDLDINFCFENKPFYKLDQGGFFEYQEDGSLERFSPL